VSFVATRGKNRPGGKLGQFAGQAACVQIGGTFVATGGSWRCEHYPVPPTDELPIVLFNPCISDLGQEAVLVSVQDGRFAPPYTATCLTSSTGLRRGHTRRLG
jgi:hypothetical protein